MIRTDGAQPLHRRTNTGGEAAPSDRDDDVSEVRLLLDQLQSQRSLPKDDVAVVVG